MARQADLISIRVLVVGWRISAFMRAIDYHLFTESLAIQLDQPVPVSVLFSGHPGEQFRRGRKIHMKRLGKVAIDAGVLFLGGIVNSLADSPSETKLPLPAVHAAAQKGRLLGQNGKVQKREPL